MADFKYTTLGSKQVILLDWYLGEPKAILREAILLWRDFKA